MTRGYRKPQRVFIYNQPRSTTLPQVPLFSRLASHGLVLSVALVAAAAASPSLFDFPDAPFSAPSLPDWSATAQKVPVESITIEPATLAAAMDPASTAVTSEAPKAETAKTLITVQGNLQKQPAPMTEPVAPQADRKSTRLNSSHTDISRMPSSA